MKLSVLVPSIRTENLKRLYDSVGSAFSGTFEFIVISPYDLPSELNQDNVKLIKSWRSPIACQQQGLMQSQGEYITWAADDGVYLPGSLDESFKILDGEDYKTVVMGKYLEGDTPVNMESNWYYTLCNHDSMKSLPGIPEDSLMLNCGLVSKQLLFELGGWDCFRFQVCPMAYNDFAIRAQKFGAKFIIQSMLMFKCSHEPGMMGTHGPIHVAQTNHDEPVFRGLYGIIYDRNVIDINNWENTPEKWGIRFGV